MHSSESSIIPYQAIALPQARGVIVFAPHPDDEIFGCGGAIALHAQAGHRVQVILLTGGGFVAATATDTAYKAGRLAESMEAARLLGIELPVLWDLPDRLVTYSEDLVGRMLRAIEEFGADVIYAPSAWELHPDHRAAAMAAIESARRLQTHATLFLYEVSAALRPNVLLDITPVWDLKQRAMQLFKSQEAKFPYASFASALNRFRALTLFPAAEHAEAFERYTASDLRAGGPLLIEGERDRLLKRGVAVLPSDAPLVSVIVRSMGRSTLAQAVASVALQTYSHLEIVLVDAGAQGLDAQSTSHGPMPIKHVRGAGPMGRALAANTGMQAASGNYFLFLDDDDWLYPDHVSKLMLGILRSIDAKAAHTEVECVDASGEPIGEIFGFPYVKGELRYGNFLPIHSVLFDRSLWEAGCRFDANFDLYEDWDFWLQVERFTHFAFVEGVSAAYRIHPGAGEGVAAEKVRAEEATKKLYAKWEVMASQATFEELVRRSLGLRQVNRKFKDQSIAFADLSEELAVQQKQALAALEGGNKARQDADHFRRAHMEACSARDIACGARDVLVKELSGTKQALEKTSVAYQIAVSSLSQLEGEVARTHGDLVSARQHAANIEKALTITRSALESARLDVNALKDSTSWKITQPLRALGRMARRMRRGVSAVLVARIRSGSWGALARKSAHTFRNEGLTGLRRRASGVLRQERGAAHQEEFRDISAASTSVASRTYKDWVENFDSIDAERTEQLAIEYRTLNSDVLISIVMPVYRPQPHDIKRAIASVRAQIYANWQLCVCDDGSADLTTRSILEAAARDDPRINLVFHATNRHISHASNSALALATGQYVAFLDQDDELRPHSLLRVVQMLQSQPQIRMLYSDEDKINEHGDRFDPYFKPDFNLGLLRSHNLMCHFAVYERALLNQLGGLRAGFEGAQDYDLVLRVVDTVKANEIGHIPSILYHWRTAIGSTSSGHGNKSYAFDAGRRALEEHLHRRGLLGEIEEAPQAAGMYRVAWARPVPAPLVSIVIPTRNGHAILKQCLDSLRQTNYPNYEIIVVDNGSDDTATLDLLEDRQRTGQIRVLRDSSPFNFSALNNRAVHQAAQGEFVLLLNNDIEVLDPSWLDEMVGPAMEPGIGCVGARLWYPDGRLQHGGVVLVCGVAGHAHKFLERGQHGYMGRAVLAQDMVAVTAACLLVRKAIYEDVGGLDESLAVAFNDVDFCLRVHMAGYRNHWTPYAELIHHESVSRGYEDTPEKQKRFQREVTTLQERWKSILDNDPCYNPNLTVDAEDFSLAWPPRVPAIPSPA